MKFKCEYNKEGKPKEWIKFTRNPFNRHFIHFMTLKSIQNDRLLSKEFNEYFENKYSDSALLIDGYEKVSWLKKFKFAKFTFVFAKSEEANKFCKMGFEIVKLRGEPFYDLVMVKQNF